MEIQAPEKATIVASDILGQSLKEGLGIGRALGTPGKILKVGTKGLKSAAAAIKRKEKIKAAKAKADIAMYKKEKKAIKKVSDPDEALQDRKARLQAAHKEKIAGKERRRKGAREFGAGVATTLIGKEAPKGEPAMRTMGRGLPAGLKKVGEVGKRAAEAYKTKGASEVMRAAQKKKGAVSSDIDIHAFSNRLDDELLKGGKAAIIGGAAAVVGGITASALIKRKRDKEIKAAQAKKAEQTKSESYQLEGFGATLAGMSTGAKIGLGAAAIGGAMLVKRAIKKKKRHEIKLARAQGSPKRMVSSKDSDNPALSETEPGDFLNRLSAELNTGTHFSVKKSKKEADGDVSSLNTLQSAPLPTLTV